MSVRVFDFEVTELYDNENDYGEGFHFETPTEEWIKEKYPLKREDAKELAFLGLL